MIKGHGEAGCAERVMARHSSWLTAHGLLKPFVRFLMTSCNRVTSKLAGNV